MSMTESGKQSETPRVEWLVSTEGSSQTGIPTMAVVVLTHSRPERLRSASESLFPQTHPPAEIIVVSNLHDQATRDVGWDLANAARSTAVGSYVFGEGGCPRVTISQNVGIRKATADI